MCLVQSDASESRRENEKIVTEIETTIETDPEAAKGSLTGEILDGSTTTDGTRIASATENETEIETASVSVSVSVSASAITQATLIATYLRIAEEPAKTTTKKIAPRERNLASAPSLPSASETSAKASTKTRTRRATNVAGVLAAMPKEIAIEVETEEIPNGNRQSPGARAGCRIDEIGVESGSWYRC